METPKKRSRAEPESDTKRKRASASVPQSVPQMNYGWPGGYPVPQNFAVCALLSIQPVHEVFKDVFCLATKLVSPAPT